MQMGSIWGLGELEVWGFGAVVLLGSGGGCQRGSGLCRGDVLFKTPWKIILGRIKLALVRAGAPQGVAGSTEGKGMHRVTGEGLGGPNQPG